ncbi:MAG: isopenicillin N synthase family oxygenase [Oceanospirillaceae bacterium]|nr:isopenicillin N synthase family oxygenase [Oceanospirillaceae bacterium]
MPGKLSDNSESFDPFDKERQLRSQASTWQTADTISADHNDIPVIDLSTYLKTNSKESLENVATQLRHACENVGFFTIIGHGVAPSIIDTQFSMLKLFHALPIADKKSIQMDSPQWPIGGVGYLPFKNRKLPSRDTGNRNEAFLIKCDHNTHMHDNQWLDETLLPGFRAASETYADAMLSLGKRLLPIFARALDMPADFFDQAFFDPLFRLRMTHYPSADIATEKDEFGIAPHVDTSFCTLLIQDRPGLSIYSEQRKTWIDVPMLEDAFIVNTGELLRQWSNDRFLSVKHFVHTNKSGVSRYSIPFFFNANSDYKMHCIPSCCSDKNPAKYPAISYSESQAVAQGE